MQSIASPPILPDFYIVNTLTAIPLNANLSENLSWLTISPTQVGVPANDSAWITVIASSPALSATNVGTIAIVNNSQNAPTLNLVGDIFTVPQGLYTMTLSTDTLDLPAVQGIRFQVVSH